MQGGRIRFFLNSFSLSLGIRRFIDGSVEFGSFLGAQATAIRSKSVTFGHRLDLPDQTVGLNEVAQTCCI